MTSTEPPHAQYETFMQKLLNLPVTQDTTYIGESVIISVPTGLVVTIDPNWDDDNADGLIVDIKSKSAGLLDVKEFDFDSFTTPAQSSRKKKDDDNDNIRIDLSKDNVMEWNYDFDDKRLEPLRAAIVRFIAAWSR